MNEHSAYRRSPSLVLEQAFNDAFPDVERCAASLLGDGWATCTVYADMVEMGRLILVHTTTEWSFRRVIPYRWDLTQGEKKEKRVVRLLDQADVESLSKEELKSLFLRNNSSVGEATQLKCVHLSGTSVKRCHALVIVSNNGGPETLKKTDPRLAAIPDAIGRRLMEAQRDYSRIALARVQQMHSEISRLASWESLRAEPLNSTESSSERVLSDRRKLINAVVKRIKLLFGLSRCGLLVPTEDDESLWTFLGSTGFPSQVTHSVVGRSTGLTGRVLQCNQNQLVRSSDIERDAGWSRRFGEQYVRTRDEPEKVPLAYLGVPVFARMKFPQVDPAGALIMVRPHSMAGSLGPFSEEEGTIAKEIANVLAYVLDTVYWRLDRYRERKWHSSVAGLEAVQGREELFYQQLLSKLKSSLPNTSMLLSIVDLTRTRIQGVAVSGRFVESIMKETVRPLWNAEPPEVVQEDSLSRFVRLRYQEPYEVDPEDDTEPFAHTLQGRTEARFRLRNPHLFIPLLDDTLRAHGVVIAVSDKDPRWIDRISREDVSYRARRLGEVLSRHLWERERERRKQVLLSFRTAVAQMSSGWTVEGVARETVRQFCDQYDFSSGLIYRFDHENQVLRGLVGYRVNEVAVRQTMYRTDLDPTHERRSRSLALRVFESKRPIFITEMRDDMVDQRDRLNVGLPSASAGFGVPLMHGRSAKGVLILCMTNKCIPLKPVPEPTRLFRKWALEVGSLLGSIFDLADWAGGKERDTRTRLAQTTIMQQIQGLLQDKAPEENGKNGLLRFACVFRQHLTSIVEDSAHIFGAQVAGMFLADQPAVIPAANVNNSEETRRHIGDQRFYLVAGKGYKPCAYFSVEDAPTSNGKPAGRSREPAATLPAEPLGYTASSLGLTAHVLSSLESQRADDVATDRRWSRETKPFQATSPPPFAETETAPSGCGTASSEAGGKDELPVRTWMGVPICLDDGHNRQLFGALCFTRFRRFRRDKLSFTEQDLATAHSIAAMVAVVLQQKQQIGRVTRLLDTLLTTFRHEQLGSLLSEVRTHFEEMKTATDGGTDAGVDRNRLETSYHYGTRSLAFIESTLTAYRSYIGKSIVWDSSREYAYSELFDDALDFAYAHLGKAESVTLKRPFFNHTERVYLDRSKTRCIVNAIVRNAIISCASVCDDRQRQVTVELECDNERGWFVIHVTDNGVGIGPEARSMVFAEGFSTFGGTGLGLAIARKFAEAANIEGRKGCCHLTSRRDGKTGAVCEVRLPIPRPREREKHNDCSADH